MNPLLDKLQPYPFEKLTKLLGEVLANPKLAPIKLSIGEPKHPAPEFVTKILIDNINKVETYPTTKGIPELRESIANWATQRFDLAQSPLNPDTQVLPVNGTREAIFSFTQACVDDTANGLVVSPNPFYQIYEGATYLSGVDLKLLPCLEEHGFQPDFDAVDEETWQRCQILFLCSPGNPTGAVVDLETLEQLIHLSDKYDFVLASDECYSEIYTDETNAPIGLLEACVKLGRVDYKNCIVFHSLSKRSNLPGLRSGFVAGDADLLAQYLKYRTYHGCALPVHHQLASIAAWNDETHVVENRDQYRAKFKAVLEILEPVMDVEQTDASFYLWAETPISDEQFAQQLFKEQNVTVVPGSYLSRAVGGINPGANRVRMALVAPVDECVEAANRIKTFIEGLK
ncbi:succinyldiaminopimelate transaminase [Oleiphilus sp. HI0009]|uniref:succinyldiaminopimelate transaminase n=2 Tax=Oleiphilus TaxID=141450 RepID=UPI0007C2546E|nr:MULTISPECIES: succinyldiaminopimelate transaminase [unclassified Oleiphilus]KZX78976.1 succinyldiaminopimelate transaminase [Oleiphilus sp. HI0009]KZY66008.1 succinyldiaminopimelate transaminase [Oleiphilus sp. HI0066]KZY67669.1 succinyldiaminopimelate transaminase [Oleiphilus sp. HI0067]KZZ61711.1 succinyldiaminopimelate transaminase [Oleiphilus sp. HI0125]